MIQISRDTAFTLYQAAVGYECTPDLSEDTRHQLRAAQAELQRAVEVEPLRRQLRQAAALTPRTVRARARRWNVVAGIALFLIAAALLGGALWTLLY
jgi:hypothetical protein